jgi:hypothetical protein
MNPIKAIQAVTAIINRSKKSGKSDVSVLGELLLAPTFSEQPVLQPLLEYMALEQKNIVMATPRRLPDGRHLVQFFEVPAGCLDKPTEWKEITELRKTITLTVAHAIAS